MSKEPCELFRQRDHNQEKTHGDVMIHRENWHHGIAVGPRQTILKDGQSILQETSTIMVARNL